MLLTKLHRRRVVTLMQTIPEGDIKCQESCHQNNSKRYYSNPWFFYETKRRRKDIIFLLFSVAYSILTLRCHRHHYETNHSLYHHSSVNLPFEIPPSLPRKELREPDYGGILYSSLENASYFGRKIVDNVTSMESNDRPGKHAAIKQEKLITAEKCREPRWASRFYPTCNVVHEGNYLADSSSFQIGNGYYREAWLVNSTETVVLKALKLSQDHNQNTLSQVTTDAVVMEQLSASPRIMPIWSLCATSLVVKSMPVNVEKTIVPPGEWNATSNKKPRNPNLSSSSKLNMALEMALSLQDLHGFKRGVIVHGDVQLGQWLQESKDSSLVLGDFNLARALRWNKSEQRYCSFETGRGHGNYRAPEEVQSKKLNEKLDVFSFGNNVYSILSGRRVYFAHNGNKQEQKRAMEAFLKIAQESYHNRSFAERKLVQLLGKCWEFDPVKRISISEAVDFLQQAVKENKKHG